MSDTKLAPDGATAAEEEGTVVYIHGISNTEDLMLELMFENPKKTGGGNIKTMDIRRDEDLAVVTYEDKEVAKRVLSRHQVSVEENILVIKPPPKLDACSVIVSGLPETITKDTVEMLFESKKRTGGGEVTNVDFTAGSDVAIVTFLESEVAKRVLQRSSVSLSGAELLLKPCPLPTQIQVLGVTQQDEMNLELYFEASHRSGGGDVQSCKVQNGVAIIQFEDPEVIPRVLKQPHTLGDKTLNVKAYYPELNKETPLGRLTDDDVVEASSIPEMIRIPNVVEEECFGLELYFEAPEKSGGGDLEYIKFVNGAAIIKFEDPSVIPNVLRRQHKLSDRTLEVEVYDPDEVDAATSLPDCGAIPAANPEVPDIIWISLDHPHAHTFMTKTSDGKTWVKERGQECNFNIDWSRSSSDKICITSANEGSSRAAGGATDSGWKDACNDEFCDFYRDLQTLELAIERSQIELIEKHLEEEQKSKEPTVLVLCDQSNEMVKIIGYSQQAASEMQKLERLVAEAQQPNEVIEHEIPLGKGKVQLFQLMHYESDLKSRVPNLEISFTGYALTLKGNQQAIQQGISLVYDLFLDSVVASEVAMNDTKLSFMKNPEAKKLVDRLIEENKMMATFEVDNTANKIMVYGLTGVTDIEAVKKLMEESLVERNLTFSGSGKEVLKTKRWDAIKNNLLTTHRGCLIVEEDLPQNRVKILCTSNVRSAVDKAVTDLQALATDEEIIQMALPTASLLQRHHMDRIRDIQASVHRSYPGSALTISGSDPETFPGFIIKGSQDSVNAAKSHLSQLYMQVKFHQHDENTPSMPLYFLSQGGQQFLMNLEQQNKAICIVDDKTDRLLKSPCQQVLSPGGATAAPESPPGGATGAPESPLVGATAADFPTSEIICLDGGKKIKISCEDLKTCKVDAIIIPTTRKLEHELSTVKDIVKYGGSDVHKACIDQMAILGTLKESSSFTTASGQLQCEHLIHVVANKGDLLQMGDIQLEDGMNAGLEDVKYKDTVHSVAIFVCENNSFDPSKSEGKISCIARSVMTFLVFEIEQNMEVTLVALDPRIQDLLKKSIHGMIKEWGITIMENGTDNMDTSSSSPDQELGAVGGTTSTPDTSVLEVSEAEQEDAMDTSTVPKSVVLTLYALDQRVVDRVTTAITDKSGELCCTRKVDSDDQQQLIRDMSPDQAQHILELQSQFESWLTVDIEKNDEANCIKICGRSQKVALCEAKVKAILAGVKQGDETDLSPRRMDGAEGGTTGGAIGGATNHTSVDESFADEMAAAEKFRWDVQLDTGNFSPLPPDVGSLLEIAFQDQQPMAEYVDDSEGCTYRVNFHTMKMSKLDGDHKVVTVRRKGDSIGDTMAMLPAFWIGMGSHDRLKVIELDKNDHEYKEVEEGFRATCANNRIKKIERIQNPSLYRQYQVKKQAVEVTNNLGAANEQRLYHGTTGETVLKINSCGFNRSYCGKNATMYGEGVYFAKEARYSARSQYSQQDKDGNRYMYQCLVLTGETTNGNPSYKEPPPKQPHNPTVRFDSVTDREDQPGIYVVFHDAQVYPEYLITFV